MILGALASGCEGLTPASPNPDASPRLVSPAPYGSVTGACLQKGGGVRTLILTFDLEGSITEVSYKINDYGPFSPTFSEVPNLNPRTGDRVIRKEILNPKRATITGTVTLARKDGTTVTLPMHLQLDCP